MKKEQILLEIEKVNNKLLIIERNNICIIFTKDEHHQRFLFKSVKSMPDIRLSYDSNLMWFVIELDKDIHILPKTSNFAEYFDIEDL